MTKNTGEVSVAQSKTPLLKPLGLSEEEVENLVAFLEAFSGDEFEVEAPSLPPYAPLATQ